MPCRTLISNREILGRAHTAVTVPDKQTSQMGIDRLLRMIASHSGPQTERLDARHRSLAIRLGSAVPLWIFGN